MTKFRWNKDEVAAALAKHDTASGVLREVGLRPAGGNFKTLYRRMEEWGLSFKRSQKERQISNLTSFVPQYTDEEVFQLKGKASHHTVRSRYRKLREDSYYCDECSITFWNNQTLTLQIDHIIRGS